jgi:hypothetical protein
VKTQIKISIPEPCHEDWNKMTPDQTGRYCKACAKGVVDFTSKSKEEIQAFFIQNQGKKVCGRLDSEQLNRFDIQIPSAVLQQKRSFQHAFLLALFVVMGASLFSCKNHSNDQLGEVVVVEDTLNTETTTGMILPPKEVKQVCNKIKVGEIDVKKYDSLVEAGENIPPPPPPGKEMKFIKHNLKNRNSNETEALSRYVTGEIIIDSTKTEKH